MVTRKPEDVRYGDRSFIGHPRGLFWLSFAELWERFSYYGMQSLLVLYMTHQLLQPGHVENVLGFQPFRAVIENFYGPLSPQALGSAVFGLYAGLVYLTPIGGGLLADRLIGRTAAVTIGAILMALGHFLMAFEASFLAALLCLLIGVGCFKGNIAAQVGDLYKAGDSRRADAFQVFLLSVQIAVIAAPFVCGWLGEAYGWDWGFGAAGIGMLFGLIVYLSGLSWLPPDAPATRGTSATPRAKLTSGERGIVVLLVALVPVLAVASVGNQQIFNAYLLWAESNYQLVFDGKTMPVTWILSFGSAISAGTIVLSVGFWRWWARFRTEPDEITKLAIGVMIACLAPLTLALASTIVASTGEKVGLGWAVAFEVINDIGFANMFPVGIALFSRASPKSLGSMLIGVFYLHLFIGNMLVGWLGGLLERLSGTQFWLLHAGLIAGAGVALLIVRAVAGKALTPAAAGQGAA